MKKVVMIVGMVLITSFVVAQNSKKVEKLAEKMAGEICECMSVETDFEAVDETLDVFMDCYLESLSANKKGIEKSVMKHKSGYAKMKAMYDFSISVGLNLGIGCETFTNFVMKNANIFDDTNNQLGAFGPF